MKNIISAICLFTISFSLQAQHITGDWKGIFKIGETELPLILHILAKDNSLVGTFDSPAEGATDIPLTQISLVDKKVLFTKNEMKIKFEGELNNDEIIGTFHQGGLSIPLLFNRIKKREKTTSQEPTKPYPYYSEEVFFTNEKENIKLAGTLTVPEKNGNFPAVILISGSGPQNRDEELLGHKPFLVLSDFLTRNGYAVLRYDDRGVAKSEGDFAKATSADFANDVRAALQYCQSRKEIDSKKIGLLGHSEGGMISPMVANGNMEIAFVIMLAGPGIPINELMLLQAEGVMKMNGMTEEAITEQLSINKKMYDIILNNNDDSLVKEKLNIFFDEEFAKQEKQGLTKNINKEEIKQEQLSALTSPWMLYFLRYNPSQNLQKLTCPVLAINGEKDIQVTCKENLNGIRKALQKNKQATILEIKGVNHLFQEAETGAVSEYGKIEQTISPNVLDIMIDWLNNNN